MPTAAPTSTPTATRSTGRMTHGRSTHTATALADGRVLVAGGYYDSLPIAFADLYDPKTGTFAATGSMTTARGFDTGTRLSDALERAARLARYGEGSASLDCHVTVRQSSEVIELADRPTVVVGESAVRVAAFVRLADEHRNRNLTLPLTLLSPFVTPSRAGRIMASSHPAGRAGKRPSGIWAIDWLGTFAAALGSAGCGPLGPIRNSHSAGCIRAQDG